MSKEYPRTHVYLVLLLLLVAIVVAVLAVKKYKTRTTIGDLTVTESKDRVMFTDAK
jgi:hypothetical protein